jgi:hypothetical protein
MKQETLKKAKNLEHDISEYNDLLLSRNADYHTMLIKITCAYSNNREDYHGRVSKEVWDKMLDVVAEERRKAMQELDNLTDDSAEIITDVPEAGQGEWQPTKVYKNGDRVNCNGANYECQGEFKPTDISEKASWKDNAVRTIDRLISWMLYSMTFCFLFNVAGLELSAREIIAYSLMLGLVVGSVNNIERVMRELFKKED